MDPIVRRWVVRPGRSSRATRACKLPDKSPKEKVPHSVKSHSQGRAARRRARHPLPACHQGHAQGDADRGGPPGDPARGGRGPRRRHRALHLRDGAQQGRDRGPLRQPVRAGAHPGGARQVGRAGGAPARPAAAGADELHAPAGAPGARPCRVVRARDRGQRAVRAAAARRAALRREALHRRDDRGLSGAPRQLHRRRPGAGGPGAPVRHRRRRGCRRARERRA